MSALPVTPLVIVVWLGFLICVGFWVSAKMMKSSFQDRMGKVLKPTEQDMDEDEDLAEEQKDAEMGKSLIYRVLNPALKKMGAGMKSQATRAGGGQVKDMLIQAGNPYGMGYPEFLGLKMFSLVLFSGVAFLSSLFAIGAILDLAQVPSDPQMKLMGMGIWIMVFAFIGYSGPTFWLRRTCNIRVKQIRKSMADVVDLMVLAVEAGLGFDQAVGQAAEKTKGPLADELRRVLDEVNVGKSQGDAFKAMAARVRMPELTLLVAAIDQAMKMGTGLGAALRLQAIEIRERRMAWVRETAGKLPVKMMIPLVFFIFPALFVVILGPAAVQMSMTPF